MGCKKAINSKEKQDIVKSLSDENTTFEIVKNLNRNHSSIKKELKALVRLEQEKMALTMYQKEI